LVDTGNSACPKGPGAASGYNCTTRVNPNPNDPWPGSIRRNNNPTNAMTNTASAYLFDSVELGKHWLLNGGVRLDRYSTSFTAARATTTSSTTSQAWSTSQWRTPASTGTGPQRQPRRQARG